MSRLGWILRPDPDRSGRQLALTVLAPILPGHAGDLGEAVRGFGRGPDSPFAAVPGLHFGRWVIVPQLIWEPVGQEPSERLASQYLLFSTSSTGTLDQHLAALRTHMPDACDTVFGHCVNYPGARAASDFDAWLRRGQLHTSLFHAGYPHASPEEVRAAVALRDELVTYALEAQELTPADAQSRYLERFGPA